MQRLTKIGTRRGAARRAARGKKKHAPRTKYFYRGASIIID
jgi:hypothetical protein